MNIAMRSSLKYVVLVTWMSMLCSMGAVVAQTRPTSEEVSTERKLIDGKKYILLGDYEKAEALFRAILEEDVQNSAACYELSRTLAATARYSDALTYIHKAIRIEPENEWYLLMEADIREKSGDIPGTMEMYDRLIALRPEQTHYYEMQLSLCRKIGDQERLLHVLDQYEQVKGVTEAITRTRFETLDDLGRPAEAMAALDKLATVYPSNLDYKFLAASYALKSGMNDRARQYYQQILAIDPENSRAKLAMASTDKKEGDDPGFLQSIAPVISNPTVDIDLKLKELIPYVVDYSDKKDTILGHALLDLTKTLVETHPKEAKAYAVRGDVLSIAGKRQAAIEAYRLSTTFNGGVYVVWEQMLSLLMAQRSYDELIRQAGLGIENFPNQAFLYYAQGVGQYKSGLNDDALSTLQDALVMTGRNTVQKISILNVLGLVYDEKGDLEKSANTFETALSLDPKNPETMTCYSLALSRHITQSDKAIAMTEKVMGYQNLPPRIQEMLAEVLYNQKKYKEADGLIRKVLATDPYGDAYNMAGDISLKLGNTEEAVKQWQMALDAGCTDPELKSKISDAKAP